jgi:ubiquinone biosynthesis protein
VYGLPDLVEEFSITLMQELDYTREGRNGDQLRENFKDVHYVRIAATEWDYTTPRVLTMERVCGVKITDLEGLEEKCYDRHAVASNLTKAFMKMIFIDGVFHGDPHPGNLVVLEDSCIGLLDYGMIGRLDRETKGYVTMLLEDYTEEDSAGFAEILLSMGTSPADVDRKAFKFDIDRLLRQYYGAPVREFKIGEVLSRSLRLSARYRVRLPASLGMLVKVIIGIEGIDQLLDPSFDLAAEARPFAIRSVMGEFSIPPAGRLCADAAQVEVASC